MKTNKDDFFREAILRISGSLEIEQALFQCYSFFKDFIPLDHLMLMNPNFKNSRMEVMAGANDQGGFIDNRHWPVPPKLMAAMRSNQLPDIMIANHPETHFVAKYARNLGLKNSSILVVRLFISDKLIGSLIFRVAGYDRYTKGHADLLAPLRAPFALALSNGLRYRELLRMKELIADESRYFQEELRKTAGEEIIGADYGLKGVMELVRQVSPLDSPVLLLGDTGTGKELIAGAIHSLSPRRQGPMITVNCGAIVPSLLDSELFGHEKGAFTGALAAKRGRFERAHQGTLFLDEVGELSPEAQVRLLRVLQEKEIERIGGSGTISIDVRVIAATHRNLEEMVEQGGFRKDLFFRLTVFPILIPPLTERKGDIPALARHFMQNKARQMGLEFNPVLSLTGLSALMAYTWPGNVRELENAVERELILCKGHVLNFSQLSGLRISHRSEQRVETGENIWLWEKVFKRHIQKALAATNGQVGGRDGAAELLGIHPSTLRSRMRKLDIAFGREKRSGPNHL